MFSLPKSILRTGILIACMSMAVFIASCSEDDESPPVVGGAGTGTLVLELDEMVGSNPLVIQSSTSNFPDTTQAGNPFNVSHLRYIVSDFRLHMSNGTVIGVEDFLYRDPTDSTTGTYTWGGIPAGTYSAISLTFGLDAEKNVTGALGTFPFLGWPVNWGGGYHYMEMNGNYFDGVSKGFLVHTGRRKMTVSGGVPSGPDSVAYHHFFEVKSDVTPFTIDGGDTWEVTFTMDILGWFKSPAFDMSVYFPSGQGIMVNLPAQALLLENGINNVYSVSDAVKQ